MSDQGRAAVGRIKARQSRKPVKGPKGRAKQLALGKEAASDLIKGTIAKNRRNQSTDSNN